MASASEVAPACDGPPNEPLSESEYRRIKQALPFGRHYWATLLVQGADCATFGLGLWLVRTGRPEAWCIAQALFAIVAWHAFAILHDCGHSASAESRWLNVLSGSWASLFCLMPFYPWKLVHQEHHKWTGHLDRDPTARGLRRWKEAQRVPLWVRVAWRTWIPAAALVQHVVLWSYPLSLAKGGVLSARFLRCALSVLLLPATYTLAHWLWPDLFRLQTFAGAIVLYMCLTELINLPHHSDMPFGYAVRLRPWQQWRTARSCDYPRGIAHWVLLNFNLHVEHHLFPTLPWYRLDLVRVLIRPALGEHYVEAYGASWNARNRNRDIEQVLLPTPAAR